jgi:hypothetical protein
LLPVTEASYAFTISARIAPLRWGLDCGYVLIAAIGLPPLRGANIQTRQNLEDPLLADLQVIREIDYRYSFLR